MVTPKRCLGSPLGFYGFKVIQPESPQNVAWEAKESERVQGWGRKRLGKPGYALGVQPAHNPAHNAQGAPARQDVRAAYVIISNGKSLLVMHCPVANLLAAYDSHAAFADHAGRCTLGLLLDGDQLKFHLARPRNRDGSDCTPMYDLDAQCKIYVFHLQHPEAASGLSCAVLRSFINELEHSKRATISTPNGVNTLDTNQVETSASLSATTSAPNRVPARKSCPSRVIARANQAGSGDEDEPVDEGSDSEDLMISNLGGAKRRKKHEKQRRQILWRPSIVMIRRRGVLSNWASRNSVSTMARKCTKECIRHAIHASNRKTEPAGKCVAWQLLEAFHYPRSRANLAWACFRNCRQSEQLALLVPVLMLLLGVEYCRQPEKWALLVLMLLLLLGMGY